MTGYIASYPVFFLFAPPIWLWVLWHYGAVAYEMNRMLVSLSEEDTQGIPLVQKAWKIFRLFLILTILSCLLNGALAILWWYDPSPVRFFMMVLPGVAFSILARFAESRFEKLADQIEYFKPKAKKT